MCGVIAVAGQDVDSARLDDALAALAHRGPDGRGRWCAPGIALGHTRLAVIDPEGGAQPITNEDGSIVAVVNGEIYDYDAHARRLASRGHVLRTRCDAELVVHLYEELGDDLMRVLRGELAFVLWDARRRRLLAARDRFGIKPLVWARVGEGIALASEAKALFALGVRARWDDEAFFHAAHVQYTWPDRTLFAGVHTLEPGHALVWEGGAPWIACHSDLPWPGHEESLPRAAERLRAALDEAVRVRVRADARTCVQLSGGIDSASIAALAARAGEVGACFTVGFAGTSYDETASARAIAAHVGLPHVVVPVDGPTITDLWPAAVVHGEGLAINGHLVGKWLLSRAMREGGYKVALTGEGADELLYGYPHLRQDAGTVDAGHAASRGVMLPSGDALSTDGVRARLGFVPTWIAAKATLGRRVRALLAPDLVARWRDVDPYSALIDRIGARRHAPPVHVAAHAWIRTALAGYILRTLGDGMEMAHGIEGRVPFLDPHVAEAALAAAPALAAGGVVAKSVLRYAVRDLLPDPVLARPKHPFLAPPLALLAPMLVQDTLRSHARRSPLVNGSRLVALLDELPGLPEAEQQAWDPALMLLLSAAILEARYCR